MHADPARFSRLVARFVVGAAVSAAMLTLADRASADEKQICAQASEDAQQLRTEGHPREARERLLVCVRDVCPNIVRRDCTQWLTEVEASLPSVVIDARDAQGHDVVAVRVMLDGKSFTDRLDGKAIAVNPGLHTFVYEMEGAPPIEEKVVIHEGEKNRNLVVAFKTPGGAVVAPPTPPVPVPGPTVPAKPPEQPPPAPPSASHGPPVLTYVLGGVAVVAGASYAYFGIKGKNDVYSLRGSCAPGCTEAQKDNASQELLIANVSFGIGVAALAAAAIVWIAQPSGAPSTTTGSTETHQAKLTPLFDVRTLPGGGMATLGASF